MFGFLYSIVPDSKLVPVNKSTAYYAGDGGWVW